MLWVKVLENDVQCSASDAEKVACEGVVVGDDGSFSFKCTILYRMVNSLQNPHL